MVGAFLLGLGGDARELAVLGAGERFPQRHRERRIAELARHGGGEVAVGPLHQLHVEELVRVAQEGELVLVASIPADGDGVAIERTRLSDQVERDVGERNVLLQRRRATRPLGEAMPQHQRVVGEAQQVEVVRIAEMRLPWRGLAHMCPTSSGMS